jgi:hypothetical protein
MNEAEARARLLEQAATLRALATALGLHGVGDRWQGSAKRSCETRLSHLEDTLRLLARRATTAAQYAGVNDSRTTLR